MSAGQWLILVGGALQALGVLITGFGALATWNTFRPGEAVLAPIVDPLGRGAQRVIALVRRKLRLSRTHHMSETVVVDSGVVSDAVSVRIQWHQIPSDTEPSEAIKQLDDRTRETFSRLQDVEEKHAARLSELESRAEGVTGQIEQTEDRLNTANREIATGGVRVVIVGLVATFIGIVLVTLGSIPPIA
jgi:hypothetical protein